MVAIFLNIDDAQKFSDKCHSFLLANCLGYNAALWQIPVKHDKEKKWYVEIPREFFFLLYKNCEIIKDVVKTELQKSSAQVEKPSEDWSAVSTLIK